MFRHLKFKTFLIAEIGINHNAEINIAKYLILLVKNYGCDAVKFKKKKIKIIYLKEDLDEPRESSRRKTQRAQKEGLKFSTRYYGQIDNFCSQEFN
jgi:N-acetylneuraminate synthase